MATLEKCIYSKLEVPDTSIALELLSPVASRGPSPRGLQPESKSNARWRILGTINDMIQDPLKEMLYGEFQFRYFCQKVMKYVIEFLFQMIPDQDTSLGTPISTISAFINRRGH
ncbi:hypothetical protein AX15_005080 [Amanita polypyramis BW_CC]|nr:hypothetical protein AX15_005080 [Amanita polypyramis BW_CC]